MPFRSRSSLFRASLFLSCFASLVHALPPTPSEEVMTTDPAAEAALVERFKTRPAVERRRVVDLLCEGLRSDAVSAEKAARTLALLGQEPCHEALKELVEALRFDEPAVAKAVIPALQTAGPSAIGPLQRALGDSNFFVRSRAADALAAFGPKSKPAAQALVRLYLEPNVEVRNSAEKALLAMGDAAVDSIAQAARIVPEPTKKPLLLLLSQYGPVSQPMLLERLKRDESTYIRTVAAEALGQVRPASAEVLAGLVAALRDLDEGVRGAVVDSLGALGVAGQPALGHLLVVSQEDKDGLVRQKAIDAASRLGPLTQEALKGLITALNSPSEPCRLLAADLLAKASMSYADAGPAFSALMKDPSPTVRVKGVQAATALARGSLDAAPLLRTATADPSPEVRGAAIQGLGTLTEGGTAVAEGLEGLLQDANPVLRRNAIQALGNLGPAGVRGLMYALKDSYSLLADEAGAALVKIGPEAVPALESAMTGPDPILKAKVGPLLRKIHQKKPNSKKKSTKR